MRIRSLAFVSSMALLALGSAGGASASPRHPAKLTVGPNVNISRAFGNQSELTIAVNPTNPKNIVAEATRQHGAGIFEGVSFDGGTTWQTRILADGDNLGFACCDESLSFDDFGNLFMTYLFTNTGQVPVALSTDGGLTFTLIARIKPTQGAPFVGKPNVPAKVSADQPTITSGESSVWLTWTSTGTIVQADGAAVTGLGKVGRFGAPEDAAGANLGDYGDVSIGPSGQVLIAYQNPTGGQGGADIYTDLDPDGLGPQGFQPARLMATTHVGGFDYIPAQPDRSVDAEVGLAYDRSSGPYHGRVYAIWTSETPNESNDMDVQMQFSDDDGQTWSQPVRVNTDTGTNSQFMPKIALDQTSGAVAVSWYDCRNDLGQGGSGDTDGIPNDDAQLWAQMFFPGGSRFGPNLQVSKGTSNAADQQTFFDYGDYEGLAFDHGNAYPIWADNSNSTHDNPNGTLFRLDMYTAKISIPLNG